jgi:hypothetical protein
MPFAKVRGISVTCQKNFLPTLTLDLLVVSGYE